MRYCYCNHATAGEPLFCNFCGRTYDIKLCPRLHVNPRHAEICSQCGSRDLSTPQPRVPFRARVLIVVVTFAIGSVLVFLPLAFAVLFLRAVLSNSDVRTTLLGIGIILALLWYMWFQIPQWLRKWMLRLIQGKRKQE
jgi:cytochrome c biogenesis protein CcdA